MPSDHLNIVIAHYLPNIVSGAENSIADFTDQVDTDRFHITMLVPGEGSLASFYRKRGFDVWVKDVQTPRRIAPGLHTLQSALLARDLKGRAVDAVLCNTFPAASRVRTACQMARLPFAIYMRDYLPDTALNRSILGQADALFAISNDVIQQHDGMVQKEKFRLAYNFINPAPILQRFEEHRAAGQRLLPFGPQHPVIGLVGRITPYKQPDLFIRAVPHVLQEVPEARFVVIGAAQEREKPYEAQIHALANALGVKEQVAFLGQRREVVEMTAEMTVSCLTSGREPLGRVILEANLVKVPVVVPDTGGPAEITEDAVTGLHFASTAPDAEVLLARQLIRLLKDPALRACLADKARERVLATFANRRHVEIQEAYIEQLCAR